MKNKFAAILLIVLLQSLFCACHSPECKTTNKIFSSTSPDKKEYKDELAREIKKSDRSKLRFYMRGYWLEIHGDGTKKENIQVHVSGDDLCADMNLIIKGTKKGIEDILLKETKGYSGAELEDFQFDIYQDSLRTEFIFKSVGDVLD